jgi:hypothetical protein
MPGGEQNFSENSSDAVSKVGEVERWSGGKDLTGTMTDGFQQNANSLAFKHHAILNVFRCRVINKISARTRPKTYPR